MMMARYFRVTSLDGKKVWCVITVLYLLIVTFSFPYQPIAPGLDPSWKYAINYIGRSDYMFGRDVVFTFGPLGYLLSPLDIGSNLIHALIFVLIMHLLFVAMVCYYCLKTDKVRWPLATFILAYVISIACGLSYEYYLLIVLALLLLIFSENRKHRLVAVSLSGFLSATFLFMKFSLGLAALTMLAAAILVWAIEKGREAWAAFLLASFSYLLALFIYTMIFMPSFGNLFRWLKASLELTSGYNTAMSIAGSKRILIMGILAGVCYVISLILYWKTNSKLLPIGVIFIGPLFLAFKQGFVRQDLHAVIFFTFIIAVVGVLLLFSTKTCDLRLSIVAFLVILAFGLPALIGMNTDPGLREEMADSYREADVKGLIAGGAKATYRYFLRPFWNTVTGLNGAKCLGSTVNLGEKRSELREISRLALQVDVLPDEWVREIREQNATLDVIPWEIAYCPANDLNWNPNPILQTYSAYTTYLDEWSASHFSGAEAPECLIVEFTDIDYRNLMWSVPATWRAVLCNYQLHRWDINTGRLLLKKKSLPTSDSLAVLGQEEIETKQWVAVPPSGNPLFAGVDFRLCFVGKILKILFRIDPIYVDLCYESGRTFSFRIVPETAESGFLINYLPTNHQELAGLLNGTAGDRVVEFRISGPGASYLTKNQKLTWLELPSVPISFGSELEEPQ